MKLVAWVVAFAAAACHAAPEVSGQVRPQWIDNQANPNAPFTQGSRGATVETELRGSGHGFTFVGTGQHQRLEGEPLRSHGFVNELYGSADAAGWQFSAGKKIVGWDVGYGFRPNDVVAQEARRTLLNSTAEGRPLLMAEHFDASTAWSFVLVNPTKPRDQRGAEEPALAARVYRRDGAIDWHGFARVGAHTGASAGAALAWVAGDSLELHASARVMAHADTLASDAPDAALLRANPWQAARTGRTAQVLIGGTWTNESQLSLLAEAWWDGTALSNAQWDAWTTRNRGLAALVGTPAPARAVAGNLAWQTSAFSASTNLRRSNLFARLSWQHDKWQPAIDVLFTPADRGHVVTGSLGWQGDRVRLDAGLRLYGGPSDSVLAQLPTRRIGYMAATWSF
ncbi:MAG: hypothetical protein ABI702_13665 [Burkholderiales bacterium]